AVEIVFRGQYKNAEEEQALIDDYRAKFASPFVAASRGFIDDIIRPQNTRWRICRSLSILRAKKIENPWKKHDNLPL
ncbi:MAG: carboxyl transferase domain-containing protein, partial [Alphaproteobacteria bacterium]|nr:carboxyl transferase domain-containing protein [Alphaproteobacteria bacterium]